MPQVAPPLYLATILLERNRWNGKGPSLIVSDWMEQIAEAGFAGLEIWMNHLLLAERSEWDLIRDKTEKALLPVTIINSYVPTDRSDRAKRIREAVNEAIDFFQPDGVKINIGGKARAQANEQEIAEALDFVKEWSIQVPRRTLMLMEDHPGTFMDDEAEAARAREALGTAKFKTILHPLNLSREHLAERLEAEKDSIVHMHLQNKVDGKWASLREGGEHARECLQILKDKGYKGTWALEFTKGLGQGETTESMFRQAVQDLEYFQSVFTR